VALLILFGKGRSASRPKIAVLTAIHLELNMQAKTPDRHWSTISIVAGVVDVLQVRGNVDTSPDVRRVVRLDNRLAAIQQAAVPKQKA